MSAVLFLFPFLLLIVTNTATASNFTATLFFGDSTLDTGNNNFIQTKFRGNHRPYGVDFPGNQPPTGRFSNGLLVTDLLTSALGVKPLSPPYLDPNLTDDEVRTGVNFASAGSGYDNLTSKISNAVPVAIQLELFGEYIRRLKRVVGEEEAQRIVEGALILFSAGGNDVLFNFYDLRQRRSEFSTMTEYQDFLHGIIKEVVKAAYNLGGRKFIVAGLPPIGCLPVQITASITNALNRGCVDEQVNDTVAYNSKLRNLLPALQSSLPGSRILYLDITDSVVEIIQNPEKYGCEEGGVGCCGTGYMEFGPLCNKYTPICEDASSYVFFDAIHPTEKVYKFVTAQIMNELIPQFF